MIKQVLFKDLEERSWIELHTDEEVEWWCHPTILMYIPKLVLTTIIALASITAYFTGFLSQIPYIGVFYGLTLLASTIYGTFLLVHWRSTYYVVTNHRAIRKDGIISRRINPANFTRVSNIKSDVSAIERIVSIFVPKHKIGDMSIHTADDNLGDIQFTNVKDVEEARQAIQANINEAQHLNDE